MQHHSGSEANDPSSVDREGSGREDEVVSQDGLGDTDSVRKKSAEVDEHVKGVCRRHAREEREEEQWHTSGTAKGGAHNDAVVGDSNCLTAHGARILRVGAVH
jgi:hypothetical protein